MGPTLEAGMACYGRARRSYAAGAEKSGQLGELSNHLPGSPRGLSGLTSSLDNYAYESAHNCAGAPSPGTSYCTYSLPFKSTLITNGRDIRPVAPAWKPDPFT